MNLRRKLAFFMALNRYVEIIVRGVPPLSLSKAKADSLTSVKAYGGLLQGGVPSGYTAVEYVQNATRTLVPTDFIPVGVTSVKVDLMTTASLPSAATGRTFYIFQARETTATTIFGISGAQSSLAISGSGTNNAITSSVTRTNGNKYRIVWEAKNGTQTLTVDDLTAETTDTKTNTYTTIADVNSPMCLFGNAGTLDPSGTATEVNRIYQGAQVYYAKMWANGKLVLDLVPAKRNSDNAVGLYNRVNGAFFTATEGSLTAGNEIVPTPSDPMDIYCNNGALKILDKSDWTIFTNPTSIAGQGVFISSDGKWYNANDRGAGCAIPLTIGKQYTLVIHKKTAALGTILRYGQSPQETPTGAGIQLTDWYRGDITDGQMISFVAKQPYLVMQLSANAAEAGMIQEAIEVLEAQGGDYTFVDSITASGTQYIDTGILAGSDIKAEVKFKSNNSSNYCALGGRDAASGTSRNGFAIWANVSSRVRFDFQSNPVVSTAAASTTNWNIAIKDGVKNYLNDVRENDNESATFTSAYNMYLFAMLSGTTGATGQMVGSIAYCKIWKAGVLVRDFMPAIRNSDNVVGMYDTVSGTFFTNAGTGTFVAGTPLGDGEVLKLTPSNDTAGVANLLKIDNYVDTQEILTGLINHQLGIYVFDGTETWATGSSSSYYITKTSIGADSTVLPATSTTVMCSHYPIKTTGATNDSLWIGGTGVNFRVANTYATLNDWTTFLAAQYTAGTPVIIVYPLATAQDEVAPVPQTMQTVAGDNVLDIVQAGMSGLEVEAKYTKAKY